GRPRRALRPRARVSRDRRNARRPPRSIHVAGQRRIAVDSAALEFSWSDEERAFRSAVRAFLAAELPSNWNDIAKDGPGSDAQVAFSRRFCPLLAERGWLTPHWPRELGGLGAPVWHYAILAEELWAVGEPRGPQYMNVNWIGPTIARY